MALLDIFKRKKPASVPIKNGTTAGRDKKEIIEPITAPKKKIAGSSYAVFRFPHITEKATDLTEENKYVFNVQSRTNKTEIKKAIENNYGVDVVKVNIINIKGKERMLGRQKGWKKGYKKAIVKIKEGQKIEVLPR